MKERRSGANGNGDARGHAPAKPQRGSRAPSFAKDPLAALDKLTAADLSGLFDRADDDAARKAGRQRGCLKLANDVWTWRVRDPRDEHGKRRRRSRVIGSVQEFPTLAAARAETNRLVEWVTPRRLAAGSSPPFPEVLARFSRLALPLYRDSSRAQIGYSLKNHVSPFFAKYRLHEVSGTLCQEFVASMIRAGLKRSTVKTIYGYLSTVLVWALGQGLAANVPRAGSVKLPRPREIGVTLRERAYTAEERDRILAASAFPERAIYALQAFAGLRVGEALGLSWDHVGLGQSHVIRIRQAAVAGRIAAPKSRAAVRDVPIAAKLATILLEYRETWRPNDAGLLFAGRHGRPRWSSGVLARHLDPLLRQLGIKASQRGFHGFRHCFARDLADAGVAVRIIMELMGHSSLAAAAAYTASPTIATRREAIERALSSKENRGPGVEFSAILPALAK